MSPKRKQNQKPVFAFDTQVWLRAVKAVIKHSYHDQRSDVEIRAKRRLSPCAQEAKSIFLAFGLLCGGVVFLGLSFLHYRGHLQGASGAVSRQLVYFIHKL